MHDGTDGTDSKWGSPDGQSEQQAGGQCCYFEEFGQVVEMGCREPDGSP